MASSSRHYTNKVCCYAHPDAPLIEDYRAGDQICSECGLVVGDRVIDVGSEWRTFSNEKSGVDPSRVGGPENPLLSGSDLSTMIGPGTGAASFDGFGTAKYQNRRTMSSSDRALVNAFREINGMADRINLPKTIVDRANTLFKQVHDGKNLKGRANDAIASACLYIACRQEGVPRTFKEICAVSKISKKEIDFAPISDYQIWYSELQHISPGKQWRSTLYRADHPFQSLLLLYIWLPKHRKIRGRRRRSAISLVSQMSQFGSRIS
ncbi:transcription initiation factor IIB isoform X2 [Harpegnathos saltator]|uniref:transcription initiation factor IIB isoform X2 n=1 Tax=Harpegnathos saltator TaxID=610380 RepID=UPI000DBED936|nr:transcription initiation factor IIB isoform X2 [Harpegnathos saltator]